MTKWKDFFYYSKADRIAIILLMLLICLSGGIYIYLNNFTETPQSYISETEQTKKEFVRFENNMAETQLVSNEQEEEVISEKSSAKKSPTNSPSKLAHGQTIDINTASATTLTRVPGIGRTIAERITEYRTALGGFYSLEQLQEIRGITVNKFSQILPYIVLKKKHRLIYINNADSAQLALHPYLNEKQIKAIFTKRAKEPINSLENLLSDTEAFTPRDIERLSPYLSFQ